MKFLDVITKIKKRHFFMATGMIILTTTIYSLLPATNKTNNSNAELKITNDINKNFYPVINQNNSKLKIQKILPFNYKKPNILVLNENIPIKTTNSIESPIETTKKLNNLKTEIVELKIPNETTILQTPNIKSTNSKIETDLLEALSGKTKTETTNYKNPKDNNKFKTDNWEDNVETNNSNTYPLKSDRILISGSIIPAIFNSRVNTQYDGYANIIITDDVYAHTGNIILIPKGSVGQIQYKNTEIKIGITRISFDLIRIITTNNVIISFKNTKISDLQGASGIGGDVDNKILQKYGAPLIFQFLNSATQYASFSLVDKIFNPNSDDQNKIQANQDFKNAFSQSNNDLSKKIVENFVNIQPTITIENGTLFTITNFQDIYFKKPENKIIYPTTEDLY